MSGFLAEERWVQVAFVEVTFIGFLDRATEGFPMRSLAASTSDDVDVLDSLKLGSTRR